MSGPAKPVATALRNTDAAEVRSACTRTDSEGGNSSSESATTVAYVTNQTGLVVSLVTPISLSLSKWSLAPYFHGQNTRSAAS